MIALPPRVPRKMTETDVVYSCLAALNAIRGVRSSRNNVGSITDVRGIPVMFGLGEGSPDIVGGITLGGVESAIARLRHVAPIAFVFCIEVKKPREEGGRSATRKQQAWHATALRRGFLVGVARTPGEAVDFATHGIQQCYGRVIAIAEARRG